MKLTTLLCYIFFCILILGKLDVNSQCISVDEWQKIIPSDLLPTSVITQKANNNLDVVKFENKYYVGFRTAPNHFASRKTAMYILSTTDFKDWEVEKQISMESDLREPRFYVKGDSLFFMFFKGGTKKLKFEPQGIYEIYYTNSTKTWSKLHEVNIPLGYVPWRIIEHNENFYLSTYDGINEYKLNVPSEFRIYKRAETGKWNPISKDPQIIHPRAIAEIEFTFDEGGDIWGIARLEYDGSYLVHANSTDLTNFEFWESTHKFDSPLIFKHNGNIFLIARRNLNGPFVQKNEKYKSNLIKYSLTKKTTALYMIDTNSKCILHITDFDSTGDCAFPGIAPINDNQFYVLNYSSDINKKDKSWIKGQLGKTFIYKTILTIEECDKYINASTVRNVYCFSK